MHAPDLPLSADSVLTVAELNQFARQTLERSIPLLWVAGEISNLTQAASGHVYFSLKDSAAQVRCVMFRHRAQLLPWRMTNGTRVEARALVTLYEPRGDFQLNIEMLRRAGAGALHQAFLQLLEKLRNEGLFDAQRKRPLPRYPRAVGLISSLQAAATRDVLAALRRRSPHVPVIIYPVPVQGEGAAQRIADMLAEAGRRGECDVLILARGGGSLEDLWSFNEEIVARALRASPIPVVCGVGHETDVTIADYAADQRAATPTAAAELVSAGYVEAAQALPRHALQLRLAMQRTLEARMQRLDLLAHRLVHPGERLARSRERLEHLRLRLNGGLRLRMSDTARRLQRAAHRLQQARPTLEPQRQALRHLQLRLDSAAEAALNARRGRLDTLAAHLTQLDPEKILGRGYSIVRDERGTLVHSSAQIRIGSELELQFASGRARSRVTETD